MKKIRSFSLRKYVFWNFIRAALLPLLFIEITLVLLYFFVNAYNHANSSETLQDEAIAHLKEIVMDQSQILSKEFTAMYAICSSLQKETTFFFQHPGLMFVASIHPAQYKFAPNGVYYRSDKPPGAASFYYSTVTAIGPAEKEKAARSEVLDHVFKNTVEANENIVAAYLNTHDSMNRYYPFIDNVFEQYLPDMEISKFNFYYLADREHNPDKEPVWTDTYLDPAGQGWMMSCIAPVYKGDFLEGVAGIDITIDNMLKTILNLKLPWNAEAFLVDRSGIIIAMPPGIEKKFKLTELRKHIYSGHVSEDTFKPEEFNLLKSPLPELRKVAGHLLTTDYSMESLSLEGNNYLLAQSTVPATGWKLMLLADKSRILSPISVITRQARQIGYAAIGCMIAFYLIFMLYLLRSASKISHRISLPIVDIAEKSAHIARGQYETTLNQTKIIELDTLSQNYSRMVEEIRTLHENLKEKIETAKLEIAERKQTQEALQQREQELLKAKIMAEAANRAKSNFLATMSHEIRTPLNAIIGLNQLVQKTGLSARQYDYISKIDKSAKALLGIINDILDFSKIEAGKMDVERVDFILNDVMHNLAHMISMRAHKKGLELIFDLPPDLPKYLRGDPMRLGQILLNLSNNAIKFTDHGEIVVSAAWVTPELETAEQDSIMMRFSVSDTGIGISVDDQKHLFKSFHQADTSTTRKFGGTGLGLAISKRLTKLMGGKIGVKSQPGKGSEFFFTIRLERSQKEPLQPYILPESIQDIKVLVVDDNKACRKVMQNHLVNMGFHVESAASGTDAVQMVEKADLSDLAPFDLIFMDWEMPNQDGIQTCRQIRENNLLESQPKIIMVTNFESDGLKKRTKDLHLDGFLRKPVTQSLIFDEIMSAFNKQNEFQTRPVRRKAWALEGFDSVRGAHILLVEDNDINRQVARELLEEEGFYVSVAENGLIGVEKVSVSFQDNGFDAVLMDLQMPVMDGYEAAIAIRRDDRFKDLPIIAMTADAMSEVRDKVMHETGMNDYITKPIDTEVLFMALIKWIKPGKRELPQNYVQTLKKNVSGFQTLPDIPGIDVQNSIMRIGGSVPRYIQLLHSFINSYSDTADQIRNALNAKDMSKARRLAHTIKGLSGTIGADELQKNAADFELLLQKNDSALIDAGLFQLDETLKQTIGLLQRVPDDPPPNRKLLTGQVQVDQTRLLALLNNLMALLKDSDTTARLVSEEIQQLLKGGSLEDTFKPIARYVSAFEAEEALKHLDIFFKKVGTPLI